MNTTVPLVSRPEPTPQSADGAALALQACAEGWLDLFEAQAPDTRRRLGLHHEHVEGGTLIAASGVDHVLMNRLVLAPPHAVDGAVAVFQRLGVPRFLLSFGADDLSAALAAGSRHGLVPFRRPWATLVKTVAPPLRPAPPRASPLPGVNLRLARPEDAAAVGALFCDAFDVPPHAAPLFSAAIERDRWVVIVAEHAEAGVVGAGMLFVAGPAAYLFGGATVPRFRRRGIQRALVAQRVVSAIARGARVVASETGVAMPGEPNPSWDNLVRAGLEPVHVSEHLTPNGTTWA